MMKSSKKRLQSWFNNQALAKKLVFIYCILIIIPLCIIIYFAFSLFSGKLEQKVGEYQLQTMKQLTLNMDTYMEELDRLTLMPYQYESIMTFMKSKRSTDQPLSLQEIKDLNSFVSQVFLNGRVDIVGVSLFGERGASYVVLPESQYVTTYRIDENTEWLKDQEKRQGQTIFVATHEIQSFDGTSYPVFSIARELKSFDSGKRIGYIVIDVDPKVIHEILSYVTIGNNEQLFIASDDHKIIASKHERYDYMWMDQQNAFQLSEGVTHYEINGERQQIAYVTSTMTGWKTIGIVPVKELMKETNVIRNTVIIIGGACLIFALLFSALVAYRITAPLRALMKLMRKVERGDLSVAFNVKQWDEVGHLGHTFNMMVSRLSELGYLLYETEIREKDAQIAALQSKINPHFLYNTLGSISMYAELKGNEEVVVMTNNLSKLLRYSLNGTQESVTLKKELDHVNGYMTIQKMRYEDRVHFQMNCSDAWYDCKVIPLIIQPLVENAINHGIDSGNGYGSIILNCYKDDGKLIITVIDDGVGIEEEQLHKLQHRLLHANDLGGSFGNGLLNVHRRIVLHYGIPYGLELSNREAHGLEVKLTLPLLTDKDA